MIRLLLAALLLAPTLAEAATLNLSVVVNGPASTTMTCPLAASYIVGTPQVDANAVLCQITVSPAGWSGALSLSGPDAGAFAIVNGAGGQAFAVGNAALTARSYSVTLNALP